MVNRSNLVKFLLRIMTTTWSRVGSHSFACRAGQPAKMGLGAIPPPRLVTPGSTGPVLVPKQSKVKNVFLATQVANVITYYSVGGPFSAMCLNFLRGFFKIGEYLQILKKIINSYKQPTWSKNITSQAELSKKISSSTLALLRCITNGFT